MIAALWGVLDPASRRRMALALVLAAVAAALEAAAIASLWVPARQIVDGDAPTGVGWTAAAATLWAVTTGLATIIGRSCGYGLSHHLNTLIADHLLRLPRRWYDAGRVGEVSRLAGSSVMAVMAYPGHLMLPAVRAVLTPAALTVAMALVEPAVGLVALALLPVLVVSHRWSLRRVTTGDAALADARREATDRVVEHAAIQRVSRLTPDPGHATRLTDAALVGVTRRSRQLVLGVVPGLAVYGAVVQLSLVALLAAIAAGAGGREPAATCVLLLLAAALAVSLRGAAEMDAATRSARGALDRVLAFLATPPLPEPTVGVARSGLEAERRPGGSRLEVRGVTVRDQEGRALLERVDLVAEAGRRTAVVGASGAGKSTLLGVLARALDPDEGTVLVDGVPLPHLGREARAATIATVPQEGVLLDTTIRANLLLGRPGCTAAELDRAVDDAGLREVVERLPDGLDTVVGEGGGLLSGGERQRVCVARALLHDTPVLLLDEATASLDPAHQRHVDASVAALAGHRTVVMVAHRLDSVRDADRIVVLDGGRVVEQGTHEDLLARRGAYHRLWSDSSPASDSTPSQEAHA